MIELIWHGRAVKGLRKLPKQDEVLVREKTNALKSYPNLESLDVKKLTDQNGLYRLRVGNYRVLFEIKSGKTMIIEIQQILRRTSSTY